MKPLACFAYAVMAVLFDVQIAYSSQANQPARGTTDFIKYAYNMPNQPPSYWKQPTGSNIFNIIDVDDQTEDYIKSLVAKTWDKTLVGEGVNRYNHSELKVINVKRIENPDLFSKYNTRRKDILLARFNGVTPAIETLSGSRGSVLTTQLLPQSMKDVLYTEINEHYFFHGTMVENVESIAKEGFDLQKSSLGYFGKGIYGAERAMKSEEYTDENDGVQNMLLVRMTLGDVYLCNKEDRREAIRTISRPPENYHSVMSDFPRDNKLGVFREFIVYTEGLVYPEYVIEFTRIPSSGSKVVCCVMYLLSSAVFSLFHF